MNLPASSQPQFNHTTRRSVPRFTSRRILVRAVIIMILGAATLGAGTANAGIGDILSMVFENMQTTWIDYDTPSKQIHIKISGQIELTPAEDDVQSLTGKALFQEKRDGRKMQMVFEAKAGNIVRTYAVNGQVQTLDAEGRRWLSDMLPNLIRETGKDSDKRIKRIYAQGGTDAVLAEIDRIQSDHARSRYIRGFATIGPLDDTSVLRLLNASTKVESDFEKRNALVGIVGAQTLSAPIQVVVLNAVAAMDSSFEQRTVLTALAPKLASDVTVSQAWLVALDHIDSAFEQRSIIEVLARRNTLTPLQVELALQSTQKIDSDFEHASALKALIRHLNNITPAQVAAYARSAQQIDSNFERSNALIKLVSRAALDKAGYAAVLSATSGMDSDFDICNVLTAVAKRMPADSDLISRYRKMARTLGDHERGQAEQALDHLHQ